MNIHIADFRRHANAFKECFHGFNAFKGNFSFRTGGIGNAENINGKLRKACGVNGHYITRPAAPNCCQSCAVGDIKHAAEFVLQLMAGPVAQSAVACDIVM